MIKKFVSIFTTAAFLITGVMSDFAYARQVTFTPIPLQNFDDTRQFIPSSLGKITSSKIFDDDNIIINIQDLHCHAETQRKIASIIEYLDTKYGLDKVYLEGAFNVVDTSWLSELNKNKIGSQVIENLLNSGRLSGIEYYSTIRNKKNFVAGIENEELYKENIKLLGEIIELIPEMEAVCKNLEDEINSIRKEYASPKARKLQKIVSLYNNEKIKKKNFYDELTKLAAELDVSLIKYENLSLYISLLDKTNMVNNSKISSEFARFAAELKSRLNYKDYSNLLAKSNNFANFENVSLDLIKINNEYEITKNLKLTNLDKFFNSLEVNGKINPIELVKEKEDFINELYTKAGRTKYEKEVNFLAEFVPVIKKYFTAEISADEYYNFEERYNRFKTSWTSYLPSDTVKNLDNYYELLSRYHKNNILRDQIFSSLILSDNEGSRRSHTSIHPFLHTSDFFSSAKKITLVVTGGFHTRGLERIFQDRKISYAIITPKITESVETARKLYTDNILYYSTILQNTINIEPLTQEPLNVSFKKVMEGFFTVVQSSALKDYSEEDLRSEIYEIISEKIIDKQDTFYGNVEILSWEILSHEIKTGNVEFVVKYRDNGNKGTESTVNYIYSDGEIKDYANIDSERTLGMIKRIKANEYANPSIILEPTTSAKKKLHKYIIKPLREISGGFVSLMPYKQLHMTIGYDTSGTTVREMKKAVNEKDKSHSIFSITRKLGEVLRSKKTSLAGTLKLMPDGVIIYEITDRDLIAQMLNLRENLNQNCQTPKIVHMTIGRIFDETLLQDTPQAKEKLAELLRQLNEKIYEINKANELAKIKTSFTVKGGFLSATGDKDLLITKFFPKPQSLLIARNLFKKSSYIINFIYSVVIAPVFEEGLFRAAPFIFLSQFVFTGVMPIIPAIVTAFTGILAFSHAHALGDIITKNPDRRNWKELVSPATFLTWIYLVISFVFPQYIFIAPILTTILHSLNNLRAFLQNKPNKMLNIVKEKTEKSDDKDELKEWYDLYVAKDIEQMKESEIPVIEQSTVDRIIEILSLLDGYDYKEAKRIVKNLSDLPEDKKKRYKIVVEQMDALLDFLKENHRSNYQPQYSLEGGKYNDVSTVYGKLKVFCVQNDIENWGKFYLSDLLIQALIPFTEIKDVNNSNNSFFYHIIDSLFRHKDKTRDRYVVLDDVSKLIGRTYKSDSKFIPYGISKLISREFLFRDEDIPYQIQTNLKDYDALKQYYFTISGDKETDKSLSQSLMNNVETFREKVLPIVTTQDKEKISDILSKIEELAERINDGNSILLETLLKDLLEIILKQDEQKEDIITYFIPFFVDFTKVKKKSGTRTVDTMLNSLIDILIGSYDINSNNEKFYRLLDSLADISGKFYDSEEKDIRDFGVNISNGILKNVLFVIYSPIAKNTLDNSSPEYNAREKTFYDVFEKLYEKNPKNISIFSYMFASDGAEDPAMRNMSWRDDGKIYGPGLNKKTLQIYINAVSKSNFTNITVPVPSKDDFISDIDELAEMFAENCTVFNLSRFCNGLIDKKENGQKLALAIVKKLAALSQNKKIDANLRRSIIYTLAKMATTELYISLQDYNLFNLDEINRLCRENKIPYFLKPSSDSFISSLIGQYRFSVLLKYLPKDILGDKTVIVQEPPVLYTTRGFTDNTNKEVSAIRAKFNTLQSILNDNNLVLALLDGLSQSKTPKKDFVELIRTLSLMIESLSLINPEHGNAAKTALDNILNNLHINMEKDEIIFAAELTDEMIKQNMVLKQWTDETISEITEIHTLINAVHQQSISDFKETIKNIMEIGDKAIKSIVATHRNPQIGRRYDFRLNRTGVEIYDLSENKLNPDIIDFIGRLSQMELPYPRTPESHEYQIEDFICMDNFLVWTTRLYVHSVDIFMNFAESDRTITISYHESGRKRGNVERIRYFSTILEDLGFSVETDIRQSSSDKDGVCSLKAVLSADYGLNEDTDFVGIATKVISLFSHSVMLDWDLEEVANRYSATSYEQTFNDFVNKFKTGDIWYGYSPDTVKGWGTGNLTSVPQRDSLDNSSFKKILQYLNLSDLIPDDFRFRFDQNKLDVLFNDVIERSFAVGRIVLDENGILKRNENYDVISYLAQIISENEEDSLNKSRLINLLPRNKLNFKTVGYIGDLIAISGYMKLQNGDYLSVKGLINPATRRMKYSDVEYVSLLGRKTVPFEELFEILREEGFFIQEQELISKSEQERISKSLHRKVRTIDTPEIWGIPTSPGNGTYIAGYITFDRNNVDKDSILVVPYTTPDDVERIKTAKAVLTTGGGVLSHAAITTREYKTPSVIVNGTTWKDNGLEVLYYRSSGEQFKVNGLSIRKVEQEADILKENAIVLVNGETGQILLFDDIDPNLLSAIQKYIDVDDAYKIKKILLSQKESKDIGRLVEYVYFQTIGDTRMPNTFDMLFDHSMPQVIKDKIMELNESYIHDKVISMIDAMNNLKTIYNPNIAYSVIRALLDKLEFIKTPEKRYEIETIREEVFERAGWVKNDLYVFLASLLRKCNVLVTKKTISSEDANKIFDILQMANAYEMFVAENEHRQELIDIKKELEKQIKTLGIKLQLFLNSQKSLKRIVSFDDIFETDAFVFGSKTTELARIRRLLKGMPNVVVPDGVGVSYGVFNTFFNIIGQKDIFLLLSLCFENAVRNKNFQEAQGFAGLITDLIEEAKSKLKETEELRKELDDVVMKTLGDTKYSVRSSGVGEDSSKNAFAGMGETLLNVSREDLFEKLLTCWQSFYSDRSINYMINSQQVVQPAVLIQPMIDVDKSCVAFSRDKYGNATIETLYGQGEGIVSGKLSPDTIKVNMQTGEVLEYSVATKNYKIVPGDSGVKTVFVNKGTKERTLNYQEIKNLINVLKRLEDDVFYAVDVEAGFKDGKIYVFQRRADTTNVATENDLPERNGIVSLKEKNSIKCNISVVTGTVSEEEVPFVFISNPLDFMEAIPVYLQARTGDSVQFVVDEKYDFLVRNNVLGVILSSRINNDAVVLERFNGGIFNFKLGEIGLQPSIVIDIDTSSLEKDTEVNIDSIRNMLAAS